MKLQPIHPLVVVGASIGGVEALTALIRKLPADLPAAVCIVMHVGAFSSLAEVLRRHASLPVTTAVDGEPLEVSHVYVAPPDHHLIIRDDRLGLTRGARENRHRPAIDPLFRTAARTFRSRVLGVILSGTLDDGVAGLFTIKSRGGLALVQDPKEAVAPGMPQSAIRHVRIDYCLPVAELAERVAALAAERRGADIAAKGAEKAGPLETDVSGIVGTQAPFSCPECNGPLFEVKEGACFQYHCNVGHVYSPQALTEAHTEALERALWIAIRTLSERNEIQQSLARNAEAKDETQLAARFLENAATSRRDTQLLREILERL